MTKMTTLSFDDVKTHVSALDRNEAATAAIHMIIANLVRAGDKLATDMKIDIVTAMVEMHRATTVAEFLRILSEDHGTAYGLVLKDDDARKEKDLRFSIAAAIPAVEELLRKKSERLINLSELMFDSSNTKEAANV